MNLNENAVKIAKKMLKGQRELGISSSILENEAKVIDCGVDANGSFEAGRLFSKACMGGLCEINFSLNDFDDIPLPCVKVWTDFPSIACLASQKAGWRVKVGDFYALGSGPARILAKMPKETFKKLGYDESAGRAVIALETDRLPTEDASNYIAKGCGVDTENLYILVVRTSSLVGSIQVSARMVETVLYKMECLGYNTNSVGHAFGIAPIAPVIGTDKDMMGLSNDMIIYGSKVFLYSEEDVDVDMLPSNTSEAYGRPFSEIFKEAGCDFYKINPEIFAPAEVYFNNIKDRKFQKAGRIDAKVIKESLEGWL